MKKVFMFFMKYSTRLISLLIIIASVFVVSSCSTNINNTNQTTFLDTTSYVATSSFETTTSSIIETSNIETTSNPSITPVETSHYVFSKLDYHMPSEFETPTRWLYLDMLSQYKYTNKLDNNTYVFCFDPLCEHNTHDCLAVMFGGCSGLYSKLDNRIYMFRSDCIYSVDFNASDLKLEYAFSDKGKNLHDGGDIDINAMGWTPAIYDNYIFFTHNEIIETVNNIPKYASSFYRFDVLKKEMICLSDNQKHVNVGKFCISKDGEIFFMSNIDNNYSLFYSDLDFSFVKATNIDEIVLNSNLYNTLDGIFLVKYDDYVFDESTNKNVATSTYLSYFDFDTKSLKKISPNYKKDGIKGAIKFLYGDENYAYYTVNDPYFVFSYQGKYKTEEVYNTHHTIYCTSLKDLNTKIVFEGVTDKTPGAKSIMVNSISKTANNYVFVGYTMKKTPDASYNNHNYQTKLFYAIELENDGNIKIIEEIY